MTIQLMSLEGLSNTPIFKHFFIKVNKVFSVHI